MIRPLRHLLAASAAAIALAVAGCGGGSDQPKGAKLPQSSVAQLNQRLDEIQRRYDDARENDNQGACDDIQNDSFPEVKKLLDGLPEDVDGKLRSATEESFARLQQLTDDGCQSIEPAQTDTTPTEATPPPTPPPDTTPPETTPPETTPPKTTEQKPNPPKKKDGGGGTGGANPGDGGNTGGGNGGGTKAPKNKGSG